MSVHKDKKRNTWYVKFNNKTKRGFLTKKEANDYEAQMKLGLTIHEEVDDSILFSTVAKDYVDSKKKDLAYSSYVGCKEKVNIYIIPNLQDKDIRNYTKLDCKKFRDYLYGLDLSTRVKNTIMNHLKGIFAYAQKYYGLIENPSLVLTSFKASFDEKMKKKDKEMSVWTNDEFNKFIAYVTQEKYKSLFITLYYTGLRLGEAMALTWRDLVGKKLVISKSMTKVCENGSFEIKDTKNVSSNREVSINNLLYLYLKTQQSEQMKLPNYSSSWFIFGGERPLSRTRITNAKDVAVKHSGVKRITIHDLRHSHASNLINEGINIVAVSRRLGHSDVSMTLKVYTHLFQKNDDILVDYLESSAQKLDDFLSKSSHESSHEQKVDRS